MTRPIPIPTSKVVSAPAHLEQEEATLFVQVVRSYDIRDVSSLRILEEGCASFQRARKARETVDKEGMMLKDKPKSQQYRVFVDAPLAWG